MSLIERYEAGEPFGDLLAEADTNLLALENDGMELAAKLGDAEHQLQGAVDALRELCEASEFAAIRFGPKTARLIAAREKAARITASGGQ
jgi:hypothetical protein